MCTMIHSAVVLPFAVRLRTGISVYQQVVYAVKKAIVSSQLLPGDPFPSVRNLSQELLINPNTAQKIVTRLVDQGLLEVKPGVGTIVGELREALPRECAALLENEVEQLVVEARRLSLSLEQVVEAVKGHWTLLSKAHKTPKQEL